MQKKPRAIPWGETMAEAIIEMVHLMYQRKTALFFLSGLIAVSVIELIKRKQWNAKKATNV